MSQSENAPKTGPWDWIGPEERRILGDVIADPQEQARWCKAMVFGTLPYMWREKASVVRELAYDKLELKPGHRVLLLGECLRICGFVDDIRKRIGPTGEIHEIDITNEARGAYLAGRRGRGGQLATWKWEYTKDLPSGQFDSVAIMQATQHTDDWRETGQELLRLLKPGRPLMIVEITLSPQLKKTAESDVHIEAWIEKIFSRIGWSFDQTPYYSLPEMLAAFEGIVDAPGTFEWRGIELFWGRNKP
jgi:hypothetical protein